MILTIRAKQASRFDRDIYITIRSDGHPFAWEWRLDVPWYRYFGGRTPRWAQSMRIVDP